MFPDSTISSTRTPFEVPQSTSLITAICREKNIVVGLMTDGRFSGGSVGLVIGHVGPEASVGGPIALLRNGDIIDLDAKKGTINVRLSKKELAKRRKKWKPKKIKFVLRNTSNDTIRFGWSNLACIDFYFKPE